MEKLPSFSGSVAENYEKYFSPMFFTVPANDLVGRIPNTAQCILEIACGTGQVTRIIKEKFPHASLVATDLFPEMIDEAKKVLKHDSIEWRAMDAQNITFDDNSFDIVVCQFGVMFFPDKQRAFNEIYRVLKQNGHFLFNTWDSIENQHIAEIARDVIYSFFKEDTPTFFKVPFSVNDPAIIETLMKNSGFKNISIREVNLIGHTDSAENAAIGFTLGNPIYNEICRRDKNLLPEILGAVKEKFVHEFGEGPFSIPLSEFVAIGTK